MKTLDDFPVGTHVHIDRPRDRFPFTTVEDGHVGEDCIRGVDPSRVLVTLTNGSLRVSGYIALEHLTVLPD